MSDITTPGEVNAEIDSTSTSHAIMKAGVGSWIVDGDDIAGIYSSLDETALNAFDHAGSSGLDVTIDPGEAYVGGWLCRDTQTTVTLPANSTTKVYVGYDASAVLEDGVTPPESENVIISVVEDFADADPRTPIWEFTTDTDTVTGSSDLRQLRKPIEFAPKSGLEIDPDLTVNGTMDIDGQLDIHNEYGQLRLYETDGDTQWNLSSNDANLNIHDPSTDGYVQFESDGQLDIHSEYGQLSLYETDGDTQWNFSSNDAKLNINNPSTDALMQFRSDGNIEAPNGNVATERGWTVRSDWGRRIEVGSSFSSEAVNGDLLFEPQ